MGFIETFFAEKFGDGAAVATFLISMLPVIELRGAIPFGASDRLWGIGALSEWQALVLAVLGNVITAAVILALLIPLFKLLRKSKFFARFVNFFEERFRHSAAKIRSNSSGKIVSEQVTWKETADPTGSDFKKMLGIFVFVAIPLPLTGVWTGAAVAVFVGLSYLKSLFAISCGALASGLVMVLITVLFGEGALSVFYFFCFAFVTVIFVFFAVILLRPQGFRHKGEVVNE